MNKTSFSEMCKILGELWLYYRSDAAEDKYWSEFFEYNDIALPLAYMIATDLALVSGDGKAEEFIEQSYKLLCEFLEVDPDEWYQNLGDIFGMSPLPPIGANNA